MWLLSGTLALALSLDEARSLAVERSLDVERAEAAAELARAQAGLALTGSLPSVVGFASANTGAGFTAFGFPRPVRSQYGVGVQAAWTLIDPGGWAAAGAARRSARGQEAMLDWAMAQARREATLAYASALAAEDEALARARAEADAAEARAATASLVQAGLRPSSDLAQVRAAEANARSARAEAEARALSRCAELQGLLGLPIDGRCALEPTTWAPPLPATATHPALVAAEEAAAAARSQRASDLLAYAPALALSATAAEYLVSGGDPGPGWSAGLTLSVPLLASGAGLRTLQGADAELRAAELALEAQRRELEVLKLSSEATLEAALAALEAREAAALAAEEALLQVDERYRAGLAGVTEWLDARRVRDEAAVALAVARAAVGAATAEVEVARGAW